MYGSDCHNICKENISNLITDISEILKIINNTSAGTKYRFSKIYFVNEMETRARKRIFLKSLKTERLVGGSHLFEKRRLKQLVTIFPLPELSPLQNNPPLFPSRELCFSTLCIWAVLVTSFGQ